MSTVRDARTESFARAGVREREVEELRRRLRL